ncbi:carbohydrate porin [Psychromonas ossibalaenae]|uniref:carbohydrate porin n=1 Tax=Psychromonas ossibalaenae TaxID=444922 RepID=UPI00035E3EF5|nr:carbohydrate porin [Psychromonas ossibalaenae]
MNYNRLSLAVAAALLPVTVLASNVNETQESQSVDDLQQQVLANTADIAEGVVFSGYARYGLHYTDDLFEYVTADGQLAGNATGRLGNEGNGGEFQFSKAFKSDDGVVWDIVLMMEHWSDEIGLKKFYAGASNVFASQPDLYLWAGRDFHQRPAQALNDYKWMQHDGQGAGFYNLDLGGLKLDLAGVAEVDGVSDSGNYALTSKLHGISLTDSIDLSLLANYGFESTQYDLETGNEINQNSSTAYQVGAVIDSRWSKGSNQFVVRYADNADNTVFAKTEDLTTLYASLEGNVSLSEQVAVEYLAAYHNLENKKDASEDRTNYSTIVRPMYFWNNVHSTWLEAGYSLVDFNNAGENSAWKVTLSQNISFGKGSGERPMLRFYATVGEADNQVNYSQNSYEPEQDTFAVGAMWEAWW